MCAPRCRGLYRGEQVFRHTFATNYHYKWGRIPRFYRDCQDMRMWVSLTAFTFICMEMALRKCTKLCTSKYTSFKLIIIKSINLFTPYLSSKNSDSIQPVIRSMMIYRNNKRRTCSPLQSWQASTLYLCLLDRKPELHLTGWRISLVQLIVELQVVVTAQLVLRA